MMLKKAMMKMIGGKQCKLETIYNDMDIDRQVRWY